MNFITCFHPIRITVHGEEKIVPCGKCDYCKSIRSKSLSDRLFLESRQHKYMCFVTLTYANYFLPKMHYYPRLHCCVSDCSDSSAPANMDSGLCIDTDKFTDNSELLLSETDSSLGFIPYLRKSDAQRWLKRLRINIHRKIFKPLLHNGKVNSEDEKSFRLVYCLCGEYGPKNLRPHMHAVLLFDREEIATKISDLLHSSWPFGRVHFKFCSDKKHCEYVSRYINMSARIPQFFRRREICPFSLFSKSQPLGCSFFSEAQISEIVAHGTPYLSFRMPSSEKLVECPLWPSLANQLFPKFCGFSCLLPCERGRLLKFASSFETFEDLEHAVFNYKFGVYPLLNEYDKLSLSDKLSIDSDIEIELPFKSYLRPYLPSWFKQYFNLVFNGSLSKQSRYGLCSFSDDTFDCSRVQSFHKRLSSGLYSLYLASRKLSKNALRFGYTFDEYLSKYELYHSNVEFYKLKCQFEFENTFYSKHPDWLQYIDLSLRDIDSFKGFAPVQSIKDMIDSMNYHSHKSRMKYEYLATHSNRNYDNSFDFFSGLDNY